MVISIADVNRCTIKDKLTEQCMKTFNRNDLVSTLLHRKLLERNAIQSRSYAHQSKIIHDPINDRRSVLKDDTVIDRSFMDYMVETLYRTGGLEAIKGAIRHAISTCNPDALNTLFLYWTSEWHQGQHTDIFWDMIPDFDENSQDDMIHNLDNRLIYFMVLGHMSSKLYFESFPTRPDQVNSTLPRTSSGIC